MSYNFAGWSFVFCDFFKKVCPQTPSFYWNIPIYRQETNFWWNFCQCGELEYPFLHLFFVMTFSYKLFPSFHAKRFWCYAWAIYILVRLLLKKKKKIIAPFYGWSSTTSRLELLLGGSLLFTTKFPEISGTHFIDLGWNAERLKRWKTESTLEPPVVLNTGLLDWESSDLTTRSLLAS